MQEMVIYGVSFDLVGKQPIVLLKTADGNKFLPIWIGHPEAAAILMKLQGATTPRPMTHDLLTDMLQQLDAQVVRITVTELRENTFYARITVQQNGTEIEVDSRSSVTVIRTTVASSCSSMSVTRSCVIGRGVVAFCSFIRIAAASGWPIQIGRNLFPSAVLSKTIGCLPTRSKLTP